MTRMQDFEDFRKRGMEVMEEALKRVWELASGSEVVELDSVLREEGGKVFRELMGTALSARGNKGRYGEEVSCSCGGEARFRQNRKRILETVLPGKEVVVEAAYYVCERCRKSVIPLLKEMGIGSDGMTVGLREMVVLAGTVESYEEASSTLLGKLSGINVSGSRIQTMTVDEGEAVGRFLEEESRIEYDGEPLHVAIDGGMVHVDDRWQEVKFGVVYGEDDRVEVSNERRKLTSRDFIAVRGGPEELAAAMEKRLPADVSMRRVAVLGDGAKWIWNFAEDQFPNRVEILDYYHAVEHLSVCASALFGEGSKSAEDWTNQQEERLMADDVRAIISALESMLKTCRAPAKRAAIASLVGYLNNNAHRMRYRTFIEQRLPIGSGAVESAVKHVMQSRMKRPGMRWHAKGADAMLHLRCLHRSTGRWSAYWHHRKTLTAAA
jgi:hypothetical protein